MMVLTQIVLVTAAGGTRTPEERAEDLLKKMTLQEKTSMLHGVQGGYVGNVNPIDRLGIPALKLNDGPQGFRDNAHLGTTTSWPCALSIAATFDESLARQWGEGMGDEFYRKGSNVQLGPGMCLARVPRNGRNFEYLSGEDPYLGYKMVPNVVAGIQSKGVIANAKHYINNNQETDRTSISSIVDERTEFEMYLPPFEGAVEADVGSVMCSYNKINDVYACENNNTLNTYLKDRLGFKGWVMSDWGATHSMSVNQGLDQEMPGSDFMSEDNLMNAVKSGAVSEDTIDDSVMRMLVPMFKFGIFDNPTNGTLDVNVTSEAHNALARSLAAAGMVLLKNDKNLLPLDDAKPIHVAILGSEAVSPTVHGGGSGQVVPYYTSTPLDAIRSRLGVPPIDSSNNCSDAQWVTDTDFFNTDDQTSASASDVASCCELCAARADCYAFSLSGGTCWMKKDAANPTHHSGITSGIIKRKTPTGPSCDPSGKRCVSYIDASLSPEDAAAAAAKADVAIVFGMTTSSEGGDRGDLNLNDGADDLIDAVGKAQPNTIAVVVTPGALLTPWSDDVGAAIAAFMPGQEYGRAAMDVIFGDVNPSARLPVTFPNSENELNLTDSQWPGVDGRSTYSEKLLVGYRYYHANKIDPKFGFGHGLSYSSFEYSGLKTTSTRVQCDVKNTGDREGAEVAQLYLTYPDAAGEPPLQLKGFSKVSLKPGESATVTFELKDRSFSIWNVETHDWEVVKGSFEAHVGASSTDIRLSGAITM